MEGYTKLKISVCVFCAIMIGVVFLSYANASDDFKGVTQSQNKLVNTYSELSLNNREKTKNMIYSGNLIKMNYNHSIQKNESIYDVYNDSLNNEYIFKNNTFTGFINDVEIIDEYTLTPKKANDKLVILDYEKIAQKYATSILVNGNNLDSYYLEPVQYVSSYNEYVFNYVKKIGEYKTEDVITVNVNTDGKVMSMVANRQMDFDSLDINKIDSAKIQSAILNYMNKNYASLNYEIESQIINKYNGKYVMNNYIKIINSDGSFSSDLITYYL